MTVDIAIVYLGTVAVTEICISKSECSFQIVNRTFDQTFFFNKSCCCRGDSYTDEWMNES